MIEQKENDAEDKIEWLYEDLDDASSPGEKAKIEASPAKMYGKKESPMNMSDELKYDGPVIDQMKSLSQMGASKVLKHMKK